MKEETVAQEVIKPSRVINSHEMAELEIKVAWYSPTLQVMSKIMNIDYVAYIYVVSTVGQALCKHFLISSSQQPWKKLLGSSLEKRGLDSDLLSSLAQGHASVKRERVEIPIQGCVSSGVSFLLPQSELSLSLALHELVINTGPGAPTGPSGLIIHVRRAKFRLGTHGLQMSKPPNPNAWLG